MPLEAVGSKAPLSGTVTIEQCDVDPTIEIAFLEHDPVGFMKQTGVEDNSSVRSVRDRQDATAHDRIIALRPPLFDFPRCGELGYRDNRIAPFQDRLVPKQWTH